jgi:hypothetical protein
MQRIFLLVVSLMGCLAIYAQRNVKDEIIRTPMVGLHYTAVFPMKDLAERYGYLNQVGATFGYKTKKNWVFGVEGNFLFGNKIHNDSLLNHLMDDKGNITEVGGGIAVVQLFSRGFNVNAHAGKIIHQLGPNPNSGLYVSFGVGYMLTKIRIETTHDVVPLIEMENKRGYDRQAVGLSTHQFIGYSQISSRNFVHFYAGFYANQGFTRYSRSYFYDTGMPSDPSLLYDFQLGIRAGWYVPIYKRKAKKIYFS